LASPVATGMPIPDEDVEMDEETDPFGNPISEWGRTSSFPLFAMIKSENIYLYGMNNRCYCDAGMILFQDGHATYFNWPDLTPRAIMPELSYFDYDGDGEKELAVTLYWFSGTGCALMDLHILKPKKDESRHISYDEYSLLGEAVIKGFTKKVTARYAEDRESIIVTFDGDEYFITVEDIGFAPYDDELKKVGCKEIVEFEFNENDEIVTKIGIGFSINSYIGEIVAKVNFDGKKFHLSDYKFIVYDKAWQEKQDAEDEDW